MPRNGEKSIEIILIVVILNETIKGLLLGKLEKHDLIYKRGNFTKLLCGLPLYQFRACGLSVSTLVPYNLSRLQKIWQNA